MYKSTRAVNGGHSSARALPSRMVLLQLGAFAICAIFVSLSARAQTWQDKIAPDLAATMKMPLLSMTNWTKQNALGRFYKVIVVGRGADPLVTNLRTAVAAAKGVVNYPLSIDPGVLGSVA